MCINLLDPCRFVGTIFNCSYMAGYLKCILYANTHFKMMTNIKRSKISPKMSATIELLIWNVTYIFQFNIAFYQGVQGCPPYAWQIFLTILIMQCWFCILFIMLIGYKLTFIHSNLNSIELIYIKFTLPTLEYPW